MTYLRASEEQFRRCVIQRAPLAKGEKSFDVCWEAS